MIMVQQGVVDVEEDHRDLPVVFKIEIEIVIEIELQADIIDPDFDIDFDFDGKSLLAILR